MKALVLYDSDVSPPVAVWWSPDGESLETYEAETSVAIVMATETLYDRAEGATWEEMFEHLSKGYPHPWGTLVLYETGSEKPVAFFRALRKKTAKISR